MWILVTSSSSRILVTVFEVIVWSYINPALYSMNELPQRVVDASSINPFKKQTGQILERHWHLKHHFSAQYSTNKYSIICHSIIQCLHVMHGTVKTSSSAATAKSWSSKVKPDMQSILPVVYSVLSRDLWPRSLRFVDETADWWQFVRSAVDGQSWHHSLPTESLRPVASDWTQTAAVPAAVSKTVNKYQNVLFGPKRNISTLAYSQLFVTILTLHKHRIHCPQITRF